MRDVSFEVQQGERLGIIGRNGAGKSTLLKILSRITEPSTGSVQLRGRVASLLEVGTGFHPELTGRENIYLNGAILGMSRAELKKKFDEIVAFAEIERFLDTPVKRYSSGMYVRLAFAVAAHLEPEILVVDEVLAVGDAQFQEKCLGKMQEISARQQRTILFVSHNIQALAQLCDRGVVLDRGEVRLTGPMDQAIECYLDSSVGAGPDAVRPDADCWPSRVTILGSNGGAVRIGDPVEVVVEVCSRRGMSTQIGIEVIDQLGHNLFWLYPQREYLQLKPNCPVKLTCRVDALNLYPGSYSIGVWLGQGGRIEEYFWDRNCLRFDVLHNHEVDYFYNFNPQSTKVYQPFSYSIG
ncbi:hypothetical protein GMLC_03150 [Geomonas limicola]|uniref:ABC transporter domain-containing protein n=1 Tax=Geomonas limicola TaxID=2740186 RepID=A0A6V8N2L5_9BACT|nr:hypothetical protein GMLC_03150 [Geomonas limicola]